MAGELAGHSAFIRAVRRGATLPIRTPSSAYGRQRTVFAISFTMLAILPAAPG